MSSAVLLFARETHRADVMTWASDMMGPGGIDDADASFGGEDEDLRDDPVSTIDLNVSPNPVPFSLSSADRWT